MRVTVFGAGNDIGQEIITELVWRGYEVRAFVTDPAGVPEPWGQQVQVVTGRLTDPPAVAAAVAWGEAVVNALDPRLDRPGREVVEGTGHIVAAMQDHGVARYIGLGSPAAGVCPKERPTMRVKLHRVFLRIVRPRVHRQLGAMLAAVTSTDLEWTIVRFLRHGRGPGRGLKYVGYFGHEAVGSSAAAADIAAFAVTQLLDTRHITAAPAVSN